ncbi:hypothetical protein Fmac_030036 [Flemingia macrophylla]|uniref:glutathione gamma-glutamylcysteinyltransferase n=1 Tax=Flemingia macrophylla TaxID=520843 RepID=A0ABD1LC23_9FABA
MTVPVGCKKLLRRVRSSLIIQLLHSSVFSDSAVDSSVRVCCFLVALFSMQNVNGYYKRTLPSPPAVDFHSPDGKQLFIEAIQNGTMEGFFKLISYFQTQSEPAFCGLATLSMVLNALGIDPCRIWKGPWRWFDESMLDCCEPLEKVKAEGISFGKFVCLAHCAGAKVEGFRASRSNIEEFRKYVIDCSRCTSEDRHVISSYCRAALKQNCKHESLFEIVKFLMDDVPILLKSKDMKDIHQVLSSIVTSLPPNFKEFIQWVARNRRQEDADASISADKKARLTIKEETSTLVNGNALPVIAANVCCQGAGILGGKPSSSTGYGYRKTHMKCLKAEDDKRIEMVSGRVVNGNPEQGVDVLIPSSSVKSCCSCSNPNNIISIHPATTDVLTVLLLSLPSTTWEHITDKLLLTKIRGLLSIDNLSAFLQEEVLHLRRHLYLLKRCKEGTVDKDLDVPFL